MERIVAISARACAVGFAFLTVMIAGSDAFADCTCRARGRDFGHGEHICLPGPNGPRSLVCGMNQNVASWIVTSDPCGVSQVSPSDRFAAISVFLPPPLP